MGNFLDSHGHLATLGLYIGAPVILRGHVNIQELHITHGPYRVVHAIYTELLHDNSYR